MADESVDVRLARIEEKLDALTERIGTDVSARINDHDRRISNLESRQLWIAGWVAGAVAFGAALEWLLGKVGG